MPPRPDSPLPVPPPTPTPPTPRVHGRRGQYQPAYVTRKRLEPGELFTATGVGVAAGLAFFYLAKVWLERTPLMPAPRPTVVDGEPEGTMHRTVTPRRVAT